MHGSSRRAPCSHDQTPETNHLRGRRGATRTHPALLDAGPDRFKGYGHNAAEDLQECLLKLVELRTEILDGVVSKESPLNLVLYVRVVVRTLCRKSSLADTPFHEKLLALETLAGLMAEMHKEAQKKLSFWVTARPERKFFPSFSCSHYYRP